MVVWEDLGRLIASNPEREFRVASVSVPPSATLERFALPTLLVAPVEEEDLPPPPPLKRLGNTLPAVTTPATAVTAATAPVTATATATAPVTATATATATAPVTATATAATVPVWTQQPSQRAVLTTLKHAIDPIVLGIESFEPLYPMAPSRSRHQMELEEAQRIEAILNDLYKSQGGRSRGWTKVGLEAMIKPRCASGGDIKELDKAKRAFLWPLVVEDKPTAAFLDFLCVAKRIRIAVWFDDTKQVVVYPAADTPGLEGSVPLYHVTSSGVPRQGLSTCADFLAYCDSNGTVVMPPTSILHSLEGLTLADLESVGAKLGMTDVTGNKATRVAKIAVFKLRQRLSV